MFSSSVLQLATAFSSYKLYKRHGLDGDHHHGSEPAYPNSDSEHGYIPIPITQGETADTPKMSAADQKPLSRNSAGCWGYLLQILFQVPCLLFINFVFRFCFATLCKHFNEDRINQNRAWTVVYCPKK